MVAAKPLRILIIDDNVGLAENIAEVLELGGHVAEVATSAEEALAKMAGHHPPDVVLTDYRLPGLDGASLVRRLLGMKIRMSAIVMSAFTDESTREDARAAGAMFLAKPVDFSALGRLVEA